MRSLTPNTELAAAAPSTKPTIASDVRNSFRPRSTPQSPEQQQGAAEDLIDGLHHVTDCSSSELARPSIARVMVTSSAYSRSDPTGMPIAIRVTRTPSGLSSRAR
jgi:hypothetical protein